MKKGYLVLPQMTAVLALLLVFSYGTAQADELSELKRKMEATTKSLREMQERIAQLEARQRLREPSQDQKTKRDVERQVERKVAEAAKDRQPTAFPDNLKWIEKVRMSGDLRYRRQDHIDEQGSTGGWENGVYRHRILARLKFDATVNNEWDLGYDSRETDADAVVGGFTESDFLGAQTDSKGHKFVFRYQLAKKLYWRMAYYLLEDTRTASDLDYRRLLGDLVWKF